MVISNKAERNTIWEETIRMDVTNRPVRLLSKLKTTVETEQMQHVLKLWS